VAYLHTDHLNTPRYATDENQTIIWRWEGQAYGNTSPDEDPDGDGITTIINLRFPGQYYDQESELHYNGARYYDPSTGRYLTADPIGIVIATGIPEDIEGIPEGLIPQPIFAPIELNHLYGYAANNPLRYIDPDGRAVQIPPAIAAAIAAAARAGKKIKDLSKNIDIDGPKGTRICQVRFKKQPVIRLDFGPFKGTHGEPRLHGHLPKLFPDKHIPLDPRSFFD